jgi:hypothetical protein
MKRVMLFTTLLAAAAAGCEGRELETRTFELKYMRPGEAEALVAPYVFTEREGAPGAFEVASSAITVRETADNLERIQRMLAEFDVPRPLTMLHFQVIRADGDIGADPAIAEVERELRRLFRFDGYDLLAETRVGVMEGAAFRQVARGGDTDFIIEGGVPEVRERGDAPTLTVEVQLWAGERNRALVTQVTIPVGHAVVLGTGQTEEGSALILVVRAEIAGVAPAVPADTPATDPRAGS